MITIFDYIEETNSAEVRQLLISAHHILQETLPPFATCSIKWKIPFYTLHKQLLGENEKLKQVRYLEIYTVEDLYADLTQQILQEAILLDETFFKSK
jgi:hypothetical protein